MISSRRRHGNESASGPRSHCSALATLLLLVAIWPGGTAMARDAIRLVCLGDDRHLIARETREGIVLDFLGNRSASGDSIVLLPAEIYLADIRWLGGSQTAVIAAGPSEAPVYVFGFDRDGHFLFRQRSHQEEGVFLHSLPGDSLVVVSTRRTSVPPEVLNARTGNVLDRFATWRRDVSDVLGRPIVRTGDLFVFDGGLMAVADRTGSETTINLRQLGDGRLIWELTGREGIDPTVPDMASAMTPETDSSVAKAPDGHGPIAAGTAWAFLDAALSEHTVVIAGRGEKAAFLVSIDRVDGRVVAAAWIPCRSITLVIEPRGNRVLGIVEGGDLGERLFVLDQMTLEVRQTLENPEGWRLHPFARSRTISSDDGSISLVPGGIGGRPGMEQDAPRALVVTWGDAVGVHWLDSPADLTAEGRVFVAKEDRGVGDKIEYRIEEWRP